MKLLLIFGTRPEAIKLAPVYLEAKRRGHEVEVLTTGKHTDLLDEVISFYDIKVDYPLQLERKGKSLANLYSVLINSIDESLMSKDYDWVLVHGDTASTFAGSFVAFLLQIKIAHVEAGLRSGNKYSPFPEELNRKFVGQLADLHFSPTITAAENLKMEGVPPMKVFNVGNTVIDAVLETQELTRLDTYNISEKLKVILDTLGKRGKIHLITAHRRENWGKGILDICDAINELSTRYPDDIFLFSAHSNKELRKLIEERLINNENIMLTGSFAYPDFVYLLNNAHTILSDSGGVQEECFILKKRLLVLREVTERPEVLQSPSIRLCGTKKSTIIDSFVSLYSEELFDYNNFALGKGVTSKLILEKLENYEEGLC